MGRPRPTGRVPARKAPDSPSIREVMFERAGRVCAGAGLAWGLAAGAAFALGGHPGPGGRLGGPPPGWGGAGPRYGGPSGFNPRPGDPSSLRDALFGGRATGDRHFGSAPPVARYTADAGQEFVLDRDHGPLLRFENSAEVWALTVSPGPRGDWIFRNDAGQPVLRASRLGGVTLFTPDRPTGSAASLVGQAGPLRPAAVIGPNALLAALTEASRRSSRFAQHLVVFEAPNVTPNGDGEFADAAFITSEAFARLGAGGGRGRAVLQRFVQVTFVPGHAADVQALGARMEIVVCPERGVAGRPSSARIVEVMQR